MTTLSDLGISATKFPNIRKFRNNGYILVKWLDDCQTRASSRFIRSQSEQLNFYLVFLTPKVPFRYLRGCLKIGRPNLCRICTNWRLTICNWAGHKKAIEHLQMILERRMTPWNTDSPIVADDFRKGVTFGCFLLLSI